MDIDTFAIIQSLFKAFAASSFFHSIKIIASFIIAILLIADILLLAKRIRGDVKIAFYGAKIPPLKKSKYREFWDHIKSDVASGDLSKAKIALIEADRMFGETLEKIGYKGKDTGERIAAVRPGQLIGLEEAIASHEVFKRVVRDGKYKVDIAEIEAALAGYEKVFRGLELLD